ncbi:MAG: tRNA 2-thiouridine(34) synthase MnmA [Ruminococcaceae bacterium]|nr:tRNA 2-thiouridine(34) synthase MnmA [Oscillospiraceae bacterium]
MNDAVMIAMSGGVDSAVAAHLIAAKGTAAGVTMEHLSYESETARLTAAADIADAAAVCAALGIPHYVADLRENFRRLVIEPFIASYTAGETPNPCIVCNQKIKFGALADFAARQGYPHLATGHYARIERDSYGRYLLRRAKDEAKDQTYVLYTLTQGMLATTHFPLGELTKSEVREIAAGLGFSAAAKGDSQDICFIPDGDYTAFIARHTHTPFPPGDFLSTDGRVLGRHNGIIHYTPGQRKGLGIALGKPAYVVSKSAAENIVVLGDNEDLYSRRLMVRDINLIPFERFSAPMRLYAKARYRQAPAPARVEQTAPDELTVEFESPQRALAPGQALVLYDGDYVVGGGTICDMKGVT